uniref:transglycosylase domain-containing protein n=1 Tax=Lacihabitans sp. LS3-19 TaxID=2487335 RepID=UPI0020CF1539|nr:transglycosylase domain-containing protein [Lacihabitans sp. LS3-19]MCP9767270.1 penicillin-binding protein [Lacihabitans sp. LS3-19]
MKLPFLKNLASGKYSFIIKSLYRIFYLGLAGFFLFIIALNLNLFWLFGKMPSVDDLDNPKSDVASEIISTDNKVIGKFFFENRSDMKFEEIPDNFINALIATEDVRFSKHSGIDARSMLRVFGGILTLNRKGGGSTISQQLAKNLFKMRQDEAYEGLLYKLPLAKTLTIKAKEWVTAIKLERRYTKAEIMTMYLNTIEFSSGAYGLKSAAKTYFKKQPKDLKPEESALLVGMIQNPSRFNPKFFPKNSRGRRDIVISQMVKFNKLSPEEGKEMADLPIVLNYSPESHNYGMAQYFREYLKDIVKKQLKDSGYEDSDLYTKGFKIYVTIDSRMQAYAEEAMKVHMKDQQKKFEAAYKGKNPWVQRKSENSSQYVEIPNFIENSAKRTEIYRLLKKTYGDDEKLILSKMREKVPMTIFTWDGDRDTVMSHIDSLKHYKRFLNIGMLAMDPRNGNIKAWVGGINFKHFKFDNVFQSRRQPGSTFKPFVYVTAIDNGFSTCERVIDEPITFGPADGIVGSYTPKNSDGKYSYESLTLRQALGQSVNTVSARLIKEFKPSKVIEYAHQLGIKSELPNSPSLCLGVGEVSLFEMLGGYGVFANQGKHTEPMVLLRIEDKNGEVIKEFFPESKEVLSKESAYKMIHLMKGATAGGGTAAGLARYGILDGNEIAAKTGTTSNFSDGWFMGMTQELIGGVWVGGEDRAIHFPSIYYGQGARNAMPAWGMFMQKVYADNTLEYKKSKFIIPDGLRIMGDCVLSPNDGFSSPNDLEPKQPALKPADDDELL